MIPICLRNSPARPSAHPKVPASNSCTPLVAGWRNEWNLEHKRSKLPSDCRAPASAAWGWLTPRPSFSAMVPPSCVAARLALPGTMAKLRLGSSSVLPRRLPSGDLFDSSPATGLVERLPGVSEEPRGLQEKVGGLRRIGLCYEDLGSCLGDTGRPGALPPHAGHACGAFNVGASTVDISAPSAGDSSSDQEPNRTWDARRRVAEGFLRLCQNVRRLRGILRCTDRGTVDPG